MTASPVIAQRLPVTVNNLNEPRNKNIVFVPGKIEGIQLNAILCDTGSHVSMISEQLCHKLTNPSLKLQQTSRAPTTLTSTVPVLGALELMITLGQPPHHWESMCPATEYPGMNLFNRGKKSVYRKTLMWNDDLELGASYEPLDVDHAIQNTLITGLRQAKKGHDTIIVSVPNLPANSLEEEKTNVTVTLAHRRPRGDGVISLRDVRVSAIPVIPIEGSSISTTNVDERIYPSVSVDTSASSDTDYRSGGRVSYVESLRDTEDEGEDYYQGDGAQSLGGKTSYWWIRTSPCVGTEEGYQTPIKAQFLVSPVLPYDCLLGMDVLSEMQGLSIHPSEGIVRLGNGLDLPTLSWEDSNDAVLLASTATLLPFEASYVQVIPNYDFQKFNTNLLLEQAPCTLSTGITLCSGVFSLSRLESFSVIIQNKTPQIIKLHHGLQVGYFDTVTTGETMEDTRKARKRRMTTNNINSMTPQDILAKVKVAFDNINEAGEDPRRILNVILKNHQAFQRALNSVNRRNSTEHKIELIDGASPQIGIGRRMSPEENKFIQEQIRENLDAGILRRSFSSWSAPIVLARKKDKTWRMCIDYRKLNKLTKRDLYPLPRIDETLDLLAGACWFSTLDLLWGFWQIPLAEDSKQYTAFRCLFGQFEYNVLPFGLTNAPTSFQRVMDEVLGDLKFSICMVYIDDIIIFSRSYEEHIKHVDTVLKRLIQRGFYVKPEKCKFCLRKIEYLGHIISSQGIHVNPAKVEAIHKLPYPNTPEEVHSFLSMAGYWRKFIRNFAQITYPLRKLLAKDTPFIFTEECKQAVDIIKEKLTTAPILAFPDFSEQAEPFVLDVDTSKLGIGATLFQHQANAQRVIAYASRALSKPESNYAPTELECLGVRWGVNHFHPYLTRKFKIRTDHSALVWLDRMKNSNSKLMRWSIALSPYDYVVEHKPGRQMPHVDHLSRHPLTINVTTNTAQRQRSDPHLQPYFDYLEHRLTPTSKSATSRLLKDAPDMFIDDNGQLFISNAKKRPLLVLPYDLRKKAFDMAHTDITAGHFGVHKTLSKIADRFWWPSMSRDIRTWIAECDSCALNKDSIGNFKGDYQPTLATRPFQKLSIDVMGPLPRTKRGKRYIIVVIDSFTKWVEAFAAHEINSKILARLLVEEVICRYGFPERILSDGASVLESELMTDLYNILSIGKDTTSPYHYQGHGQVERMNGILREIISHFVNAEQNDWDLVLPFALFAYRSCKHTTTSFSPHFLMFGRESTLPMDYFFDIPQQEFGTEDEYIRHTATSLSDAFRQVRTQLQATNEERARVENRRKRPHEFKVDDLVIKRAFVKKGKFSRRFEGPFIITKIVRPDVYELSDYTGDVTHEQVNIEWILPYKGKRLVPTYSISPEDALSDDEEDANGKSEPDEYQEPIPIPRTIHSFKKDDNITYQWNDGTTAVGKIDKTRPNKVRIILQNGIYLWIEEEKLKLLTLQPTTRDTATSTRTQRPTQPQENTTRQPGTTSHHRTTLPSPQPSHHTTRPPSQAPPYPLESSNHQTPSRDTFVYDSPSAGIPNYDLWRPKRGEWIDAKFDTKWYCGKIINIHPGRNSREVLFPGDETIHKVNLRDNCRPCLHPKAES